MAGDTMRLLAIALALVAGASRSAGAEPSANLSSQVVPIRWDRFARSPTQTVDMRNTRAIFGNCIRYNLAWIPRSFREDTARRMYILKGRGEMEVRTPAQVAYGLAVALKTGAYDAAQMGVPEPEATRRAVWLTRGIVATHLVNGDRAKGWGDQWQSAHWAGLVGDAAWLLWDDLDAGTREAACRVVEHEADRFIAPGYKVPYWKTPDDREVFKGDTKAEENAWNSMVLHIAVAMMPRHPHTPAWKRACDELMVSAFAMKKDLAGEEKLDGVPLKDWLHGYNVRDDGAVINHGIVHPDYTATPTISLRTYLIQSLAGQPVSQTADLNHAFIWRSMSTHGWVSPPCKAPGGTMYIPGRPDVYYPMGTDWSPYRFDIYYLFDAFADALGWDRGLPHSAKEWMRIRAARILGMQARHADGHMWTKAEAAQAYPNDQMLAWQMADAWLLQWLNARHAISRKANWLTEDSLPG